jgi:hypothetical protein
MGQSLQERRVRGGGRADLARLEIGNRAAVADTTNRGEHRSAGGLPLRVVFDRLHGGFADEAAVD